MDDKSILDLFNRRSETAITATADKYGKYLSGIACNILHDERDSDECVNDTYLRVWNAIPPHKPENLKTFLGKIVRNLALDKYKYYSREKRYAGQTKKAVEELEECLPSNNCIEQIISDKEFADILNLFLGNLPQLKRKIFVRRYWYLSSISEIAKDYSISESNAKIILFRTRNELKLFLEKEGVI